MAGIEERLARLEEELFFQDKNLRELNESMCRQQRELDMLARELGEAGRILRAVRELIAEKPVNGVPPHYPPHSF